MLTQLNSPGNIGPVSLKNRMLMAGMGSNLSEADGRCGERIQAYYETRARGGAAMLIMGAVAVSWPRGSCNPNQVAISDERFIPGLSALAERVHRHDARLAVQLQHAGKVAVRDIAAGRPMLVPSIPESEPSDIVDELSAEEMAAFVSNHTAGGARIAYEVADKAAIEQLIADFTTAAERAREAGVDGIELHAAHGYILSSFLSPHSNQRDDEYGGSLENRARLLLETLRAVKAAVGDTMAVWCRIDATEFRVEGGIRLAEAVRTAAMAAEAGADAIHVSAYGNPSIAIAFTDAPLVHKPCGFLDFAAAVKKAVPVPVIAVGRIEPVEAERALAKGQADFIAMARKLLADPMLPSKVSEDRIEEIRGCIYCYNCVSQIFINAPLECTVRPETGREHDMPIVAAAKGSEKRVLVIGGGPAGMEAARVAAQRGHEVHLCERDERLGGKLFPAALMYAENGRLQDYLIGQLKQLPVKIECGREATTEWVRQLAPDAVIVATGARAVTPRAAGLEQPHVLNQQDLYTILGGKSRPGAPWSERLALAMASATGLTRSCDMLRRASRWWMPVGRRVAVVGGDLIGLELAEFLAERGRQVTVLHEGDSVGAGLFIVRRWRVLDALRRHGVTVLRKVRADAVDLSGVIYSELPKPARNGDGEAAQAAAPEASQRHKLRVDTVIIATAMAEDKSLGEQLSGTVDEVHYAGDCNGPGYIRNAMMEGAQAGRAV